MSSTETCPACGAVTPVPAVVTTHRYMASSPGCWARFGEVLAREYENAALMHVHGLTVDAYALQHPGAPGPQTIQSVNVHLASLFAHFRRGVPPERLADVRRRVIGVKAEMIWRTPPAGEHTITVTDVWSARTEQAHVATVRRWAGAVFAHWRDHHDAIERLLDSV